MAVVADFVADFFVAQIQFGAEAGGFEFVDHFQAVIGLFFGDVHHHHLHGCEPQREGAGVLFNQDADEALQRAQNGAVQHHGAGAAVVFGDVFGIQALGQHEVELDGAALPGTAERVFDVVFHFRAVERAFAGQFLPFNAAGGERVAQALFGLVPNFVRTGTLFGAQREFDADVFKAELFVNLHGQLVEYTGFFGDLVFGAEDVGVVLHEAAYAHQAVQRAGRLVAVAGAEFGQAHGQVAVGAQAVVEHLHVAGAVHRFDGIGAFFRFGNEHVFVVVFPVA